MYTEKNSSILSMGAIHYSKKCSWYIIQRKLKWCFKNDKFAPLRNIGFDLKEI